MPYPEHKNAATAYDTVVDLFNRMIDYEKADRKRFARETKEEDLERFRNFLASLGSPQFHAPAFHVAGTKGKGSTCALLSQILTETGKKVGLYTSPHLDSYCERIRVNGELIPESHFAKEILELANNAGVAQTSTHYGFRTVFELLTACAFVYFKKSNIDVAVIETGLGGRLDATNVFGQASPLLPRSNFQLIDVITSVGFDHMETLGSTITEIAQEKAGIIQPGGIVVVAKQKKASADEVHRIVTLQSAKKGTRATLFAEDVVELESARVLPPSPTFPSGGMACEARLTEQGQLLFADTSLAKALRGGSHIECALPGLHQVENLRTVLTSLLAAEHYLGIRVPIEAIRRGARNVRWGGRFEVLSATPPIIVDGAHCELSTAAMVETYRMLWPERPVRIVAGFLRDKSLERILHALGKDLAIQRVYCCQPSSPRALAASEVAESFRSQLRVAAEDFDTVEDALARAWRELNPEHESLICFGSMYLVSPFRRALSSLALNQERDGTQR